MSFLLKKLRVDGKLKVFFFFVSLSQKEKRKNFFHKLTVYPSQTKSISLICLIYRQFVNFLKKHKKTEAFTQHSWAQKSKNLEDLIDEKG